MWRCCCRSFYFYLFCRLGLLSFCGYSSCVYERTNEQAAFIKYAIALVAVCWTHLASLAVFVHTKKTDHCIECFLFSSVWYLKATILYAVWFTCSIAFGFREMGKIWRLRFTFVSLLFSRLCIGNVCLVVSVQRTIITHNIRNVIIFFFFLSVRVSRRNDYANTILFIPPLHSRCLVVVQLSRMAVAHRSVGVRESAFSLYMDMSMEKKH